MSEEERKTSVADEIFAWDRTVSRLMDAWWRFSHFLAPADQKNPRTTSSATNSLAWAFKALVIYWNVFVNRFSGFRKGTFEPQVSLRLGMAITPESFQWIGGHYKLDEGEHVSLLNGDLKLAENYRSFQQRRLEERQRSDQEERKKRRRVLDFLKKQGFDPLDLNAREMEIKTICCGIGKRFYQTAIHKAARDQNVHMISLLLQFGADPKSKDSSGKTAFDYIKSPSWRQHLQILHTQVRTEGALSLM